MDAELKDDVEEFAKNADMHVSQLVRKALREYMERHGEEAELVSPRARKLSKRRDPKN